jgi:hypothetical protein
MVARGMGPLQRCEVSSDEREDRLRVKTFEENKLCGRSSRPGHEIVHLVTCATVPAEQLWGLHSTKRWAAGLHSEPSQGACMPLCAHMHACMYACMPGKQALYPGQLVPTALPPLPQVIVSANDTGSLPCMDAFSDTQQRIPMLASVPDVSTLSDPSSTLTISSATTAVASYLMASGGQSTWASVNDLTTRLYGFLGVDYSGVLPGLPPSALIQPLQLAKDASARSRALGVALMAVEAQVSGHMHTTQQG